MQKIKNEKFISNSPLILVFGFFNCHSRVFFFFFIILDFRSLKQIFFKKGFQELFFSLKTLHKFKITLSKEECIFIKLIFQKPNNYQTIDQNSHYRKGLNLPW